MWRKTQMAQKSDREKWGDGGGKKRERERTLAVILVSDFFLSNGYSVSGIILPLFICLYPLPLPPVSLSVAISLSLPLSLPLSLFRSACPPHCMCVRVCLYVCVRAHACVCVFPWRCISYIKNSIRRLGLRREPFKVLHCCVNERKNVEREKGVEERGMEGVEEREREKDWRID